MRRLMGMSGALVAVPLLFVACARVQISEPDLAPVKDYYRPLPPGSPSLRKIADPARLPDFRDAFAADRDELLRALEHSIRYFSYPASLEHFPVQGVTHARAAASLIAFRDLLGSVRSGQELHERILATFDVYESVGCDDQGTVLFTGYYTPIFDARLTPTAEYRWPLHRLPPDLVKDADGACLGRRLPGGEIASYYTRAEIAGGALNGHELAYLKDRFEAYVCTVQGSAHLRLPGGRLFKIGYHGNNGMDYTSVGRLLVADGVLPVAQLSLAGLMSFFRGDPEQMNNYLPRNERYVFFEETDQEPTGSLGVPVTHRASLATDKRIFSRGCLVFVDTFIPSGTETAPSEQQPFRRLMLDQDTGGAIRAAGRADIYLGIGARAGRIAGWTLSEGRLYYLLLKE